MVGAMAQRSAGFLHPPGVPYAEFLKEMGKRQPVEGDVDSTNKCTLQPAPPTSLHAIVPSNAVPAGL